MSDPTTAEQPAVEQPAAEQPAVQEPAAQEPASQESAAEKIKAKKDLLVRMMLERRDNPMCDTKFTSEGLNSHQLVNPGEWKRNKICLPSALDLEPDITATDSNGRPRHPTGSAYTYRITGFNMVIEWPDPAVITVPTLTHCWIVPLVNCKKDWFVQHGEVSIVKDNKLMRLRVTQRAVNRHEQGGWLESKVDFLDLEPVPEQYRDRCPTRVVCIRQNPPCDCEENREP